MSAHIRVSRAVLGDDDSVRAFLAEIPNGDRLLEVLDRRAPVSSRAYDDDAWIARFVASDGACVKCFAVEGITIDQAEMIAAVCPDVFDLDEDEFRDCVERALGPTLQDD